MLLIGSRATQFYYRDARNPSDYDFIASNQQVDDFLKDLDWKDTSSHAKKRRARVLLDGKKLNFEFELVEHYPSSKLIYENSLQRRTYNSYLNYSYYVAHPKTLYLIKKSHITFNIHWWKNIYDYLFLSSKLINKDFVTWEKAAYDLRYNEIVNRAKRKQMNFNVGNSEFFNKSEKFVKRVVEHDSLHYATCFYDKPLFLSAKEDISKAALSPDKVWKMPHNLIIQMIQEECMALSLERFIIPALLKKEKYDAKLSYRKTAGRMIYNYLPPFMKIYAVDHFLEFMDPPIDYVTTFLRRHPTFFTQQKHLL